VTEAIHEREISEPEEELDLKPTQRALKDFLDGLTNRQHSTKDLLSELDRKVERLERH
jgi:hypothetical protein